jgi:Xaa-Pro dipeptidase
MAEDGLTQMIITDKMSVFYLTGKLIDSGSRLMALYINESSNTTLIINELFTLPEDIGIKKLWYNDTQDAALLLCQCVDNDKPLGIDKDMPAKFLIRLMEQNAATAYVNASPCVDRVRACKNAQEAELMRRASALNDRAMEKLQTFITAGMTEIQLSDILLGIYKELGTDGISFEPLIGFGPNAAIGHHLSGDTSLKDGDCILLDIGCKKDAYCADMTRTLFYRSVSDRMRTVYTIVKTAGDAARRMIKPGVRLRDIDGAARSIITAAGFGQYFTHRLGHFIGLEVHESGDVSSVNETAALPGMTFSIEPGIYLPGEGGVRIEDLVLVTEDGCEVLNHLPRELMILPV